MIVRHLVDRRPRGRAIAWGRKLTMDGALLAYHLFRRDMRNAVHQATLQYASQVAARQMIAGDLRLARRKLRDQVDLALMEAAEQPLDRAA